MSKLERNKIMDFHNDTLVVKIIKTNKNKRYNIVDV